MLKLLKHDIKDSYLEITVLNGLLIVLSAIGILVFKAESGFLIIVAFSGWIITFAAASFMLLNCIIKSFHKKLFTEEGYLTLTTPVSIDKILLSKIIVNILWVLVTIIAVVASILIVIQSLSGIRMFAGLVELFKEYPLDVFKIIVEVLVSVLQSITMLILVLVLTNLGGMKRHKLLKGILIYMAISLLIYSSNVFQTSVSSYFSFGIRNAHVISKTADYILGLAINLGWSAAFYFTSRYLITNRLELE